MIGCAVFNARSISSKLRELYSLLYSLDYDVMMILKRGFPDSILDPHRSSSVVRCDRPRDTAGGGVCACVRKSIRVAAVDCASFSPHLEICSFDVYSSSSSILGLSLCTGPAMNMQVAWLVVSKL